MTFFTVFNLKKDNPGNYRGLGWELHLILIIPIKKGIGTRRLFSSIYDININSTF